MQQAACLKCITDPPSVGVPRALAYFFQKLLGVLLFSLHGISQEIIYEA